MESPPRLDLGTIYIAPFMKRLIYYHSTCPEFSYGDGKVLSIQPHPTCGSASTSCVLCLNLIKGTFNIVILDSHTLAYIQQSTWHFHLQTPTYIYHAYHISNLTYIYHASHIKPYLRQQTNEHISSRQEHRHGMKQACDRYLNIQPSMFILIIKVNLNACCGHNGT